MCSWQPSQQAQQNTKVTAATTDHDWIDQKFCGEPVQVVDNPRRLRLSCFFWRGCQKQGVRNIRNPDPTLLCRNSMWPGNYRFGLNAGCYVGKDARDHSTHLKNICQTGSFPHAGAKTKNNRMHHPAISALVLCCFPNHSHPHEHCVLG